MKIQYDSLFNALVFNYAMDIRFGGTGEEPYKKLAEHINDLCNKEVERKLAAAKE